MNRVMIGALVVGLGLVVVGLSACTSGTPGGAKAIAPQSATPETRLQTTCPVMGGEINQDLSVDHDGKRIYVCCPGCIDAVKKDPGKYIKQLEAEGITLTRTPVAK